MRKWLLYFGYIEGISLLMLLGIVIPMKYFLHESISLSFYVCAHLFIMLVYITSIFMAIKAGRLSWLYILVGVLLSLLPFGSFLFEKILRRTNQVNEYDQIFHRI